MLNDANNHFHDFGAAGEAQTVRSIHAAGLVQTGLPGQITFFASIVPISGAMGVPVGALPLLLAVETIPDIFRTIGNVTGDVGITAVLARSDAAEGMLAAEGGEEARA